MSSASCPHFMWLRLNIFVGLAIIGMMSLSACQIYRPRPEPVFGPTAAASDIGFLGQRLTVVVGSNIDCLAIGAPLTVTLTLTNTSTTTYSDTLPIAMVDLRLTSAISRTERKWQWSETRPPVAPPQSITLVPQQGLALQRPLHADPAIPLNLVEAPLSIEPVLRYRNPYRDGELTELLGNSLYVPVRSTTTLGACPTAQP